MLIPFVSTNIEIGVIVVIEIIKDHASDSIPLLERVNIRTESFQLRVDPDLLETHPIIFAIVTLMNRTANGFHPSCTLHVADREILWIVHLLLVHEGHLKLLVMSVELGLLQGNLLLNLLLNIFCGKPCLLILGYEIVIPKHLSRTLAMRYVRVLWDVLDVLVLKPRVGGVLRVPWR